MKLLDALEEAIKNDDVDSANLLFLQFKRRITSARDHYEDYLEYHDKNEEISIRQHVRLTTLDNLLNMPLLMEPTL